MALALLSLGISGVATDRHLVIMLVSVELIFVASIVLLVEFFSTTSPANPDAVIMLISIFAVAAIEIVTLVTFYVYIKHKGGEFDMSKLSKMKW